MLRSFHYIDEKGKDQGINGKTLPKFFYLRVVLKQHFLSVRNRANEIASLLVDLDKIRTERRKAKANRSKYTGIGSDPFSGGRYSGMGSDSLYGGSGSIVFFVTPSI